MIKAIFFDWGNTFVSGFNKKKEKEIEKILKPFGFNWKSFYPLWRSLYYLRSLGEIKTDREMTIWCKRILQRNDFPLEKIIKLRIESHIIPSENIEIVKALKKNYKVGVITNNVKEWVEKIVRRYKIENLFDGLSVSSEIGIRKPDARIFYVALKKFRIKPQEAIFISDEIGDDLTGAKGCGMRIIWLNQGIETEWSEGDKKVLKIIKPDGIIKGLKEIIPIIKKF